MKRLQIRCMRFQPSDSANVRTRIMYVGKNGPVPVERAALEYYSGLGRDGLWAENQYWWHLMAILFWQAIFARIPGVFSPQLGDFPSRFQDMPHDFFKTDFYTKRFPIIQKRMQELRNCASISKPIGDAYSAHLGEPCRPIEDWNKYSLHDLCSGAENLTRDQLLLIMDRLLVDFNNYRSGLPDLFFYQPEPLFVEVKSESDSIRDNQIDWLQFLSSEVQVAAEVLLVNHQNQKTEAIRRLLETRGFDVCVVENSTQ
jgi:hypothetical protein